MINNSLADAVNELIPHVCVCEPTQQDISFSVFAPLDMLSSVDGWEPAD